MLGRYDVRVVIVTDKRLEDVISNAERIDKATSSQFVVVHGPVKVACWEVDVSLIGMVGCASPLVLDALCHNPRAL